ncbi:unnamed protein product [Bursaphelenchus xylophilus]|uniref:(pine wood nematode) hypothetical protein n=1 Tax=Bursaphelenchus xylophilus TaxID=6326 RepID=A0A1I7RNP7_BURXY|nr:unnamed protein product [Bursaphelenchus xylophilus]CAG9124206.1 unnamed protein product [Bursaphelenchus xylophilus]
MVFDFLLLFLLIRITNSCHGGGQYSTLAARNRALAYAAQSFDADFHNAKCASEDYGFYRAKELKRLATEYEFSSVPIAIGSGGTAVCGFDSDEEKCAWYNRQVGTQGPGFKRARFESFFDVDKFECTSNRIFAFEDYFLMAGGEDYDRDISAAIETRIPCQFDKAYLKFDYWSNNETPVLKVCVIPEDTPDPQCEESHMDSNPLTFEIPQSLRPFRLRVQVDSIGKDDIVFLDSIRYEGKFCEVYGPEKKNTTTTRTVANAAPTRSFKPTKSITDNDIVYSTTESIKKKKVFGTTSIVHSEDRDLGSQQGKLDVCEALSCDFNHGDSCYYSLSGLGGTAEWRIGEHYFGNPHTGIHKANPIDQRMTGFAFVGLDRNDFSTEVFVLESARFFTKEPVYLVFDLYQRSVGPQLRVCVNSFDNCPYVNPPLNAREFWRHDQRILLDEEAEKVYFIAGKVGRNLYLAIDNIRLQTSDFEDYCSQVL